MPRKIYRLQFARQIERPACIPNGRPRGIRATGIRYQNAVDRALARMDVRYVSGPWFEFRDANGPGFCQPDFILWHDSKCIVLECKLTENETAYRQLNGLYLPVVEMAIGEFTCGAIVTRHLTRNTRPDRIAASLDEMLEAAARPGVPIWHYLERGPA